MEDSQAKIDATEQEGSQQISLREFYMVIFVHKWTIATSFVIMLLAIFWGLSVREELYIASVKFYVNRALPQASSLRSVTRLDWEEEINSIAEMGRSQGVLIETAIAFDALRGWVDPPEARTGEMAFGLATMIEVVPVQETDIINIMVRDADADTSIILADLYGQAFLSEFRRVHQISHSREFFEGALSDVEMNILSAKGEKAQLQETMNLYDWKHEQIAISESVQQFQRELTRARMARTIYEEQVELESGYFDDPESFILTTSLREDKLVSKLEFEITEMELDYAEIRSRYAPGHRVVQAKATELESARLQLENLITKTIEEHQLKLEQLLTAERVLEEAIVESNKRLETVPTNVVKLEYFDDYITAQWALYKELITKFSDVQASDEQSLIENRIVRLGPPNIGGIEGLIPRVVYVVVAPLFALLLAVAIAFMKEATAHTFQKPMELEEYCGLPVLANFRKL